MDYESRRNYSLRVEAEDSGVPRQFSELDITVAVQDYNDNSPIFRETSYMFTLSESAPALSTVGTVSAADADSGQNGKVFYRMETNHSDFGKF